MHPSRPTTKRAESARFGAFYVFLRLSGNFQKNFFVFRSICSDLPGYIPAIPENFAKILFTKSAHDPGIILQKKRQDFIPFRG